MSQTVANFFSSPDGDVVRQNGNPMLVPRGLNGTDVRAPYTRASSLASYIQDEAHLHRWEMRYLAKAMGKHEDLAALAGAETYSTGLTNVPEIGEKRRSGRRLDDIIERALDRERIHEKADYGSAFHALTEPGNDGHVPARMVADFESIQEARRRNAVEIVGTEIFTANDVTMSAGTFDHLERFPGHPLLTGYVVTDKKTGGVSEHEWLVQLASYAYGDVYNIDTDARDPWPGQINLNYAVIYRTPALTGKTEMWILDIDAGWQAAQHAAWVRDYQIRRDLIQEFVPATFEQKLEAAGDDQAVLKRVWASTDDETERAIVLRKAGLL